MPALTARETARYGVRLFGYLLASTLLGVLLIGAGVGLGLAVDPGLYPGGAFPGLVGVAPVAAFGLLGVVAVVTGVVVVVFAAVTEAVRLGIDGARAPDATVGNDGARAPDATVGSRNREAEDRDAGDLGAPSGSRDDPADESGGSPTVEESAADPIDPTDPIDDPHSASSDPLAGPAEADGEVGDDEAWREEIEAKLDDDRQ